MESKTLILNLRWLTLISKEGNKSRQKPGRRLVVNTDKFPVTPAVELYPNVMHSILLDLVATSDKVACSLTSVRRGLALRPVEVTPV